MSLPISLKPETLISQFVDHTLPMNRQTAFAVALDKRLHGILTLEDLQKLPRERWRTTVVRDIMRPVEDDYFVGTATPLRQAQELMRENGAGALAVVDERGLLVGFLQKGKVRRKV
jgi:CBS domain-containing protein